MKIGYAMYSARELTTDPESMRKVLSEIAKMGYQGVEFFLYHDTEPGELKKMLEEFGLEAIGTHVHKPRWDADAQGEIDYAVKAGIPYLVYPYVDASLRTEEYYRALPAILKDLAAQCREKGIQLQYHNHDFEFEKIDGMAVMDYLLEQEKSFTFELDTFWCRYAGIDAMGYMEKLGSCVPMIHIKDYLGAGKDGVEFTAIGTGKLDNTQVILKAREMNKDWLIVELDNSPLHPLESAQISIEAIRKVLGLTGVGD